MITNLWNRIGRRASFETDRILKSNRYYNWYVFCRRLSNEMEQTIMPHYTQEGNHEKVCGSEVVVIHNGWTESGGLADRLRGIVSTFLLCKEIGRDFRIMFTHPFPLEMFLQPNTYDWRIHEENVRFSLSQASPVFLEIGSESRWQSIEQKKFLRKHITEACEKQVHVYTNALFAYHENFSEVFHELFKPSERLQHSIDRELTTLGKDYVSVSARFVGALGDFDDTVDVDVLPTDKKEWLLNVCMTEIEKIHTMHPEATLLVNSDSNTFLQRAQQLPYVHIISGTIIHLDVTKNKTEEVYETYEKTFLDFFMIANAKCIYRLTGKWVRPSGFPYAASLINGRPFHSIDFTFQPR